MEGVELEVTGAAMQAIARKAHQAQDRRPRLRSILKAPCSTPCTMICRPWKTWRKVVIDEGMIEGRAQPLLIYADQPKVRAPTSSGRFFSPTA